MVLSSMTKLHIIKVIKNLIDKCTEIQKLPNKSEKFYITVFMESKTKIGVSKTSHFLKKVPVIQSTKTTKQRILEM